MKKIRTPREGAGAALSVRSTTTSNNTPETPPEAVLSGFSGTTEHFSSSEPVSGYKTRLCLGLAAFFRQRREHSGKPCGSGRIPGLIR